MNTFIIIEDIVSGTKRNIEIDTNHREIYEEEIQALYEEDFKVVAIYERFNRDVFFLSKEMVQKYLIVIKTYNNEVSN